MSVEFGLDVDPMKLPIWPFRRLLHRGRIKTSHPADNELAELDLARQRFKNFEKFSADWLWETNDTGELVYVSPRLAEALVRPRDELLGKRLGDLSNLPRHLGRWQALQSIMGEQRDIEAMEVPVKISGEKRWWQLSGSVLRAADGQFLGYRGIGRDVTEWRSAEATLLQARQETDRARDARSHFLNVLSHELRTPLNAIIGFSEIMAAEREGPLGNGSYSGYARSIVDSSRQLQRIINDIIDSNRIESPSFRLNEQEVDAAELAQVTLRNCRQLAAGSNVSLTGDYRSVHAEIRGDLSRLKQILENLLSNAVKFTPALGTVHLLLRDESDGGLAFVITDSGIGIQKEDLERIFEPFVQVDVGMSRKFGGTGLGLPIAHKLAVAHGGRIDLESSPGVGTTVIFRLPPERIIRDRPETVAEGNAAA
jgi:PAS domain S-box-containing protein